MVLELETTFNHASDYPVFNVNHQNNLFQNEMSYIRIHAKFVQAKTFKILRLLENSSLFNSMKKSKLSMLIEKTVESCDICSEERKQERKPRNSTMRALNFNESMKIDLTQW